jgi:hypothetical protein
MELSRETGKKARKEPPGAPARRSHRQFHVPAVVVQVLQPTTIPGLILPYTQQYFVQVVPEVLP